MSNISHYTIKDFDTLESIATRFLGNPDLWTNLVATNNLRYPFISNDPKYQYGVVLQSGTLGFALPAGSTTITLTLLSDTLATTKGVFLIQQTGSNGVLFSDAMVLSANGFAKDSLGTTQLNFTKPTVNAYDATATWSLFSDPILQTSKVLKTGDVLVILGSLIQDKNDTTDQYAKLLGTDALIDDSSRQIAWDSKTHDLATVSGTSNVAQAIRLKIMTAPGEITYHPTYGDRLITFVGQVSTAVFASMSDGLIKECVLQDPRIFSVENVITRIQGDIAFVDLNARLRGLDTLVKVSSLGIDIA